MKRTVLFRILTVLYLAAVAFLCFADFNSVQDIPTYIFGIPADKIVHFCMFLPFPVLAPLCFRNAGRTPVRAFFGAIAAFIGGCIIAAATELVQSTLPYRTADPGDFKADTLGIAIGCIIALLILAIIHRRKSKDEA